MVPGDATQDPTELVQRPQFGAGLSGFPDARDEFTQLLLGTCGITGELVEPANYLIRGQFQCLRRLRWPATVRVLLRGGAVR